MKCRAMTRIMHICVVLVVMVSVFFYVPMEVSAEVSGTSSSWNRDLFYARGTDAVTFDFSQYLNSGDGYYIVEFDVNSNWFCDNYVFWWRHLTTYFKVSGFEYSAYDFGPEGGGQVMRYTYTPHMKIMVDSSDPVMIVSYEGVPDAEYEMSNVVYSLSYNVFNVSAVKLSSSDSNDYQNGYNAGFSAGESAGYGNGYSQGFTDGEASVDTDAIYDEAFQAGKDSVDTQSYYDAGYQAGYQVAYSEGYESGYNVGYQDAMDRIANWGADTSDYPLLIQQTDGTFDLQFDFIQPARVDDVISDYCDIGRYYSGIDFNPNHTYRLDFTYHDFEYDYSDSYFTAAYSFWLYWGSCSFPITVGTKDDITSSFYISGDHIGTGLKFRCDVSSLEAFSEYFGVLHYYINDCTLKLYDMGPSGDTQNHIANQTDQLTNGYDSSQGAAVNDDFKASVNEYHTAEDSLFSTATTSLENFTFLDFTSITGMVTSLSFVTSIMTSIYMAMGGDTGASGIILAVLFSVMLVSMAIGLYRYYVSNGKSDGSGKGGG